jgi:hypothetical protein
MGWRSGVTGFSLSATNANVDAEIPKSSSLGVPGPAFGALFFVGVVCVGWDCGVGVCAFVCLVCSSGGVRLANALLLWTATFFNRLTKDSREDWWSRGSALRRCRAATLILGWRSKKPPRTNLFQQSNALFCCCQLCLK